jgi:nucleoside-diphosphate-sugar epimerase
LRILVTGANGFIGTWLVRELAAYGHEVRCFIEKGTSRLRIESKTSEIVQGDIRDSEILKSAAKNIDTVIHLAAKLGDRGKLDDFLDVNCNGTRICIDAAISNRVRRFILMSSVSVHSYRDILCGDETLPRDADYPAYAVSKIRAEQAVEEASKLIETVIIRPGLVIFGPDDRLFTMPLIRQIKRGIFAFSGRGEHLLCTSYVENLIRGIRLCAEKEEAANKIYIISDNNSISWREFILKWAEVLRIKPSLYNIPEPFLKLSASVCELASRIGFKPPLSRYTLSVISNDLVFSGAKAVHELGYNPEIDIDEGIRRSVRWFDEETGNQK